MNPRLKFKLKLFLFSTFIIVYFFINYINLNFNNDVQLIHRKIDSNSRQHSTKKIEPVDLLIIQKLIKNISVISKIYAKNDQKLNKKIKYTCLDGSLHQSKTLNCFKAGLTVEMVVQDLNNIDFEVFLDQIPIFQMSMKKHHYLLVFSMESEPHSRYLIKILIIKILENKFK